MASHSRKRKEGALIRLLNVLELRHNFLEASLYSFDSSLWLDCEWKGCTIED